MGFPAGNALPHFDREMTASQNRLERAASTPGECPNPFGGQPHGRAVVFVGVVSFRFSIIARVG
jgi:hypothetical protein